MDIRADSIAIAGQAVVSGAAFCNDLDDSTGTVTCSPLGLPVFAELPVFEEADVRPEAEDVFVAASTTVVLAEGAYRDITVDPLGTVVFSGGIYDVLSITGADDASLLFDAPSQIRVEGKLFTGKNAILGPSAGAAIGAADIVFYVGGINGVSGGISEKPAAVMLKDRNSVTANIYAPRGRAQVSKESVVNGAILAADIHLDKKVAVKLDSAFANQPPVADPKDVFTNDQPSINIVLSGVDPDGALLTFVVTSAPLPSTGTLKDSLGNLVAVGVALPSPIVTFIPIAAGANAEDSFDYTVTDDGGEESNPAKVRINPPGDPTDPPDPTAEVVANNQLCASSTAPIDCSLQTIVDTPITLVLTAAAPCDPTDAPNPAEPCDGVGNDVPLTFSLPSSTTSAGGTVDTLVQGTGHLQEPMEPPEDPQRTATVLYTPPSATFTGVDSFTFTVVGDVDNSGGIDPSAEPNDERDTATVEISVQTFTPRPPVVVSDQRVSTQKDTPVIVTLSGPGPTGRATSSDIGTTLTDSAANFFQLRVAPGDIIHNDTDGSASVVDTVAQTQLTHAQLTGGEEDDWDFGDAYRVQQGPAAFGATAQATSLLAGGGLNYFTDAELSKLSLDARVSNVVLTSVWRYFEWLETIPTFALADTPGPPGPGDGEPTFDFILTGPGCVSVTDILLKGDQFSIYDNGIAVSDVIGTTPDVPGGMSENIGGTQADPDIAFADPTYSSGIFAVDAGTHSIRVEVINDSFDGPGHGYLRVDDADSAQCTLASAFSILTLPADGTLSYISPDTGAPTNITTVPLLLPTEQVTYTPPPGVTGPPDPLASFTFQQFDGITSGVGMIELFVGGAVIIVDECAEVGREAGCTPGSLASASSGGDGASGESPRIRTLPFEQIDALIGPTLTVVVEGPGTVTSNPKRWVGDRLLGLVCTTESVCGVKFPLGALVRLLARPDDDAEFVGWQGQCQGGDITEVPINGDTVCRAVFGGADKLKVSTGYRTVPTRE